MSAAGEGLRACPFADDATHPDPAVGSLNLRSGAGGWFVSCRDCEARGPWHAHAEAARERWNARRAPAAPSEGEGFEPDWNAWEIAREIVRAIDGAYPGMGCNPPMEKIVYAILKLHGPRHRAAPKGSP